VIDALLFAIRDTVRDVLGYDARTCDVRPDGEPPPRCGDVFVAVHQGPSSNDMMNALNEYYDWSVTLSMRVTVPQDRIGDQLLARKLADAVGFNARAHRLKVLLHMNWLMLGVANNYLVTLETDAEVVYAFAEPAHFADMDIPALIGGEWFGAKGGDNTGLVAELRFARCRRFQALQVFS
jgi:hypothetical protein